MEPRTHSPIRRSEPPRRALQAIARALEGKSPEEVLRWAIELYHPRLAMATAFGLEGCVVLSMLSRIEPHGREVRVFNLDTGYQFPETLELRERLQQRYGIPVRFVRAPEPVEEMESRHGGPIYGRNPDECCRIRKVTPLRHTLAGAEAWITAIRRNQTSNRSRAGVVEWDEKFNLVKINPMANWSEEEVWSYIRRHDVPYNPLHDKGYPSIGCWPCTRPVGAGEDPRAGRWAGLTKLECGIHTRP